MAKVFVTVGTYRLGFDELVKAADQLAGHEVRIQYGFSSYKPVNCPGFDFLPSLMEEYRWADVVVCTGGAGTIYTCLELGKRLVSVIDQDRIAIYGKDEYWDITTYFESRGNLVSCDDPSRLVMSITTALAMPLNPYIADECRIAEEICRFIDAI